ncbi:hypothetical protein [Bacillus cereus]|uniref:hypothetical protein n=1 Tax=Bacillus cereus TaxID=1396 RepID=UPI0005310318|nr:hypothetical protein [Bacillus cereus]KGT40598.1 hypothetical protein IY08_29475 [Bacillus cereus]MED3269278.1 hypothetical protein [Bacillus thuringiensis]
MSTWNPEYNHKHNVTIQPHGHNLDLRDCTPNVDFGDMTQEEIDQLLTASILYIKSGKSNKKRSNGLLNQINKILKRS